jgi:hypothetical protein
MIFFYEENNEKHIDPSLDNMDIETLDEIKELISQPSIYKLIFLDLNSSENTKENSKKEKLQNELNSSKQNIFEEINSDNQLDISQKEEEKKFKEENTYQSKNYILKSSIYKLNKEEKEQVKMNQFNL